MNQNLVEVVVIADRSGSMVSIVDSAIEGFLSFVKAQAALDGEVDLSLYTFDDSVDKRLDKISLKKDGIVAFIEASTRQWFSPRGGTALYDTLMHATSEIGKRLASTPEAERPGKVLVLIITDGAENASRLASKETVRAMIEEQTNVYKWEFAYIGANQDSILTATTLGISPRSAINFSASAKGMSNTYEALNNFTSRVRYSAYAGVEVNTAFSEEEREAAAEK